MNFELKTPTTKKEFYKTIIFLIAALLLGFFAIFSLRQEIIKDQLWPWVLLVLSMVLAGSNLKKIEPLLFHNKLKVQDCGDSNANKKKYGVGIIVGSILFSIFIFLKLFPDYNKWHGTFVPWLISIFLFFVGSVLLGCIGNSSERVKAAWGYWPEDKKFRRFEIIAFLIIFALSIFLRVYRINEIPPGLFIDETNAGLDALYILEGRDASPFATGWYGTPNGYIYYMAGVIKLLGANWMSLKIISLIPAILTIPATYFLVKLLFGPIPGLIAMLLMAISRWHLTMSRWGWNELAPPLFLIAALFFLVRGLRDRRASDYAISGIITGLMTYTYLSSRLATFTILLFIVYWFLTDPVGMKKSFLASKTGILIFLLSITIVLSPILVTYITDPFTFNNRVNEITIIRDIKAQNSIEPFVDNLFDTLKFFHQTGDLNGRHNLPGEPMADPFTGLFLAIGVFYAVINLRDYRYFLLITWLIIGLSAGFLSLNHQSPQAYRTINALPAAMILAAAPIDLFARSFNFAIKQARLKRLSSLVKYLPIIFIISILTAATLWEANTYFVKQANSISVLSDFNPTENEIAREVLEAYRSQKKVYVSPRFYSFSPLNFLMYGEVKDETGENTLENPPYKAIIPGINFPVPFTGQDVVILLDKEYYSLFNYFANIYPNAHISLGSLPNNDPLYMKIEIPKEQLAAIQGVIQRTKDSTGEIKENQVDQIVWQPTDNLPVSVEWYGYLQIENGANFNFISDKNFEIFIDDQLWTGPKYLGRGFYYLVVKNLDDLSKPFQLSWKIDDGEVQEIPFNSIFNLPSQRNGLLSSYFKGIDWEGDPVFQQITPFLLLSWPDQYPIVNESYFSARFTGTLLVNEPGDYQIVIEADDGARLLIDDVEVAAGLLEDQPNDLEVRLYLSEGQHKIQVDYFQTGGGSVLRLLWAIGDRPLTPIPPEVLLPY